MTSAQEAAVTECKNASSHATKANHTQDVAVSMLCGAVAGAVAKTAVAPVERVKMSFQISSNAFTLSRAFRHGQEIVRSSGVKSLWRGHSTTLIRVIPLAGITFATHDCLEAEFKEYLSTDRLPIVYKFLAGAIAGASGTFITYPLDVMRVRLALTPGTNWGQTLRRGGFYQGLGPTMLGIVPYSGTAWMMKQTMLERFIAVRKKAPSIIESLIINALAGLTGQFITYPLDVVRRRMQMAVISSGGINLGLRCTIKHLILTEGIRGLAKGFSLNIIKGPITMTLSFTTYDLLLSYINQYRDINVRTVNRL